MDDDDDDEDENITLISKITSKAADMGTGTVLSFEFVTSVILWLSFQKKNFLGPGPLFQKQIIESC